MQGPFIVVRKNHANARRRVKRRLLWAIGIGAAVGFAAGQILGIAMLFAKLMGEAEASLKVLPPPRSELEILTYLIQAMVTGAVVGAVIGLIAFFIWQAITPVRALIESYNRKLWMK